MKPSFSALAPAAVFLLLLRAPCIHAQSAADDGRERNRVAVLGDPEVSAEADFLAAELSGAGFEILERSDLRALAAEGKLASGSLPPSLASAGGLVLVESIEIHGTRFLATRLVGRDDGRVHAADLRGHEGFEREWAREIGAALRTFRMARRSSDAGLPKVSLQAIREEFVAGRKENELVGIALTRLVSAELSRGSSFELLERHDLSLVQFERFLTRIDAESFAKADFIVTGTVHRENGSARFELQVARAAESESEKAAATVESEDLPEIAAAMAERLVPLLAGVPGREARRVPTYRRTDEASRFAAEADRAIRLGLHESAATFAETAYLLSDDGDMDRFYLLATTELLSVLPGLRGKGLDIQQGFTMETGPTGQMVPLDLASAISDSEEYGELPMPNRRQWEVLVLSAERAVDLRRRAQRKWGDDLPNGAKTTIFSNSLYPLLREVVLNAFAKFNASIPEYEREMLGRISSVWTAEFPEGPLSGHRGMLRSPIAVCHEDLVLAPSRERAVERIQWWLYGPHLQALRNVHGSDYEARDVWDLVRLFRIGCLSYFEYLGYDPEGGDEFSTAIDKRIVGGAFVAWLSGSGTTFDDSFETAVATAPEEYRLAARIDSLWRRAALEKNGEGRIRAFSELRRAIRENLSPLRELGMLELYAYQLANLEWGRRNSFADEDSGEFWREIHAAVHENDCWVRGDLTSLLADCFDGRRWTLKPEPGSAARAQFLAVLEGDWLGNRNPLADLTRRNVLRQLAKAKEKTGEPVPRDTFAAGTLEGVPESETVDLERAMWGYDQPTLATCVANDGIYQFQHGDAYDDFSSRVLRFSPGDPVDQLTVPDEVRALVDDSADVDALYRVQRIGAIEVDGSRISLAFPGGTAAFDRSSRTWSVTPVPFLAQRSGMAFVGDRVVSFVGASYNDPTLLNPGTTFRTGNRSGKRSTFIIGSNGHGQGPSVQGLYLTTMGSLDHFAVIDTSRQPPKWIADTSQRLEFSLPPLAADKESFLVGLSGNSMPRSVYRVRFDGDLSEPGWQPIPFGFDPGDRAKLHGTKANGFVLVASARKLYNPGPPSKEGRMDIGAFAIGPDGKPHWLLDTGTLPDGNPPIASEGMPARPIFPNGEEPLYRFPEEFATHRGLHCLAPVLNYDGTRLIMLTGQFTADGRRLLYVWKRPGQEGPKRLALRFAGFEDYDKIDDAEKRNWNQGARNTVSSMFVHDGDLYFEYPRGFFLISLEEFDKAVGD